MVKINPLQNTNFKCDLEAKQTLYHSVEYKWPPIQTDPVQGWFYHIGLTIVTRIILGMLRDHASISLEKDFLVSNGRIYGHAFGFIKWDVMDEAMRLLPMGSKFWIVNFLSRFCGTVKMMKTMGLWYSNICPCCIQQVETILCVLHCDQSVILWVLSGGANKI